MMKSFVAGAGVNCEKPAPSVAAVFVWHPAAIKLSAQLSQIHARDFLIVPAPFFDEIEGTCPRRRLLRRTALRIAAPVADLVGQRSADKGAGDDLQSSNSPNIRFPPRA